MAPEALSCAEFFVGFEPSARAGTGAVAGTAKAGAKPVDVGATDDSVAAVLEFARAVPLNNAFFIEFASS